jgi:hypothetical protein
MNRNQAKEFYPILQAFAEVCYLVPESEFEKEELV